MDVTLPDQSRRGRVLIGQTSSQMTWHWEECWQCWKDFLQTCKKLFLAIQSFRVNPIQKCNNVKITVNVRNLDVPKLDLSENWICLKTGFVSKLDLSENWSNENLEKLQYCIELFSFWSGLSRFEINGTVISIWECPKTGLVRIPDTYCTSSFM